MDPRINPYAPGAETPPPELAGRDAVLADARLAIQRNRSGRSARSFMFVGLRGVGKTVLLNEVQAMAEEEGALTDFIEVANNEPLSITVIATLRSILLKLDRIAGVSGHVKRSLRHRTPYIREFFPLPSRRDSRLARAAVSSPHRFEGTEPMLTSFRECHDDEFIMLSKGGTWNAETLGKNIKKWPKSSGLAEHLEFDAVDLLNDGVTSPGRAYHPVPAQRQGQRLRPLGNNLPSLLKRTANCRITSSSRFHCSLSHRVKCVKCGVSHYPGAYPPPAASPTCGPTFR